MDTGIWEKGGIAPIKYFNWWEFKMDLTPCTLASHCPVLTPCTICKENFNSRSYFYRAKKGILKWLKEGK